MRRLRIISIIICLVIVSASFSACGKKDEFTGTGQNTNAAVLPETEDLTFASETVSEIPGDTVEETVAAEPETQKPTEPAAADLFDISECGPVISNGKYVFNPYLLSAEAKSAYGEDFAKFYKAFINAYMNYETSCPCPSEEYAQLIDIVINYECPFCDRTDFNYNWATGYDYDKHEISWTYNVDKDALAARIYSVTGVIQNYLGLVSSSDSEADKVQKLYHALSSEMTYDYERMDSREKVDSCYAFLEKRGVCVTFAMAFSQLLEQVGMTGTIASGQTDADESHSWNFVCVDGNYYYFDITFELNYNNGSAYVCYGMTLDERIKNGVREEIMVGRYQDYDKNTPDIHLNVH